MTVAIAFHSGSGHTGRLVEVMASEFARLGQEAVVVEVETIDASGWAALGAARAIVFAAPTYMGSVSAPMKAFMDQSSDIWGGAEGWNDKLAAGVTVATFPSGDKLSSLMQMVVFATQHGMIWIGLDDIGAPVEPEREGINEDGFSLGLGATSVRDKTQMIRPGDDVTARRFAARIAQAVERWGEG